MGISNPLVGDGYCNDITNNVECVFDGGDCCGSCVNTKFCTRCECIMKEFDPDHVSNGFITDGICHDDTNNANCNFDGGDCCESCTSMNYCLECLCHVESPITFQCKFLL